MEITLGPLLYFWPKERVQDFYRQVCEWPVDRVYLGETVCSKRRQLTGADWEAIAHQLQDAGKTVVFSTLALLEAVSDMSMVRRICANGRFSVEANDMAAVQVMSELGLPFTAGPQVNIYNAFTLKELMDCGLERWVLPLELSGQDLQNILAQANELGLAECLATEVFSWGMMPLASSARCFTARAHKLPKDQCEFVCMQYPEGLPIYSQEGDRVFTLNGIQTQSGYCLDILTEAHDMKKMGVNAMRISPQPEGTGEVVERLGNILKGSSRSSLKHPAGRCQGYWYGKAGMIPLTDVSGV